MVEHLLRERLSRRGICRAVGVSLTWLLQFMVARFAACRGIEGGGEADD